MNLPSAGVGVSDVMDGGWPEIVSLSRLRKLQGVEQIRKFSPYLLIELLLPGGTLIALFLWLYRRKFANRSL